jgi:hypothetical protein
MPMMLEKELPQAGCTMDPEAFRRLVVETCVALFPGVTEEDLVHTPDRSKRFCNLVREKAGAPNLPDRVITQTLTNQRKRARGVASVRRRREEECLQTTWYFA